MVTDHHEEGTHGFILNRPLDIKINDIFEDSFPELDAYIYEGGPVSTDTLHFLHNVGDLLSDTHKVADGLWWGGDFDELKFLIEQKLISSENVRFFVGYAGWEKGQLEREIFEGTWVLSECDSNYVFRSRPLTLWSKAMSLISETHGVIGQIPDTYFWN